VNPHAARLLGNLGCYLDDDAEVELLIVGLANLTGGKNECR
jgi:hypothetical protein